MVEVGCVRLRIRGIGIGGCNLMGVLEAKV